VEDVANYLDLARKEVGIKEEALLSQVLSHLCEHVNPLALGAVYRAREQIGMLASKLLRLHMANADQIAQIVKQLTRELLSHDYTLGRREARSIGLPVIDAPEDVADCLWQIYEAYATELHLAEPLNAEAELKSAQKVRSANLRGIVESRDLRHNFQTTQEFQRVTIQDQGRKVDGVRTVVLDEGWRKV
jgi:hypothetical protein